MCDKYFINNSNMLDKCIKTPSIFFAILFSIGFLFNRMCTHQTKVKRNGKIMDFDDTWVG